MPRDMPPDFGEIGCVGAGFVDELTVKHYDQTIRQFQHFVEVNGKPAARARLDRDYGLP